MPGLLRVVKSRLFLALRWKGKRKCRPTPQMRNGASTTSLVRMFPMHSTRHLSCEVGFTAGKQDVYGAPLRPSFPVGAAQW